MVTPLAGVHIVQRQAQEDARGAFARVFCAQELAEAGWNQALAQVNHSRTTHAGSVRGLHWQRAPHAEMKLVSCLAGAVWDVAVDLRPASPTYGRWHAQTLSAENQLAMLIPEGCAHGFQSLSDGAELLYCHSMPFAQDAEAGVHALDAQLAIRWPLPVSALSARDGALPRLAAIGPGPAQPAREPSHSVNRP